MFHLLIRFEFSVSSQGGDRQGIPGVEGRAHTMGGTFPWPCVLDPADTSPSTEGQGAGLMEHSEQGLLVPRSRMQLLVGDRPCCPESQSPSLSVCIPMCRYVHLFLQR